MKLNVAKTVLIPLWGGHAVALEEAKHVLAQVCPAWGSFQVVGAGKYLGIWIGPTTGTTTWDKPLLKFKQRVIDWTRLRLGMPRNAFVYRVDCFSTLSFVAQLDGIADQAFALERVGSAEAGVRTWELGSPD